jgi:hypothetical protein
MAAERDTSAPGSRPEPRVVICAWCGASGQEQAAVRGPDASVWEPASHAFAQVAKRAGFASHGICPSCREREMNVIQESEPVITPQVR